MTRNRAFALGGALLTALVLAFVLQDVIRMVLVLPLAYLWWGFSLLYGAIPQVVLWVGLIILVASLLLGSLTTWNTRAPLEEKEVGTSHGSIEDLALVLEKTHNGIYNKWKVANRLGRLARDLLIQCGDRENEKGVGPLTGRDWQPSEPVREYLEVGLNGSFADYPNPRWRLNRPQPTPLDLEVGEAVEFLEAQMEVRSKD